MKKMDCDAHCYDDGSDGCNSAPRWVVVFLGMYQWRFKYCQAAIDADRAHGLTVEEVE
jgi:hypothetical protein